MNPKNKDPNKVFTIVIGGDMDADERELFENPEKGMKQPRHKLYLKSYSDLQRWLSPAKVDLLTKIMTYRIPGKEATVEMLAHDTQRIHASVSRDLHKLSSMNLVQLKKRGKNVLASTPFESIKIVFA